MAKSTHGRKEQYDMSQVDKPNNDLIEKKVVQMQDDNTRFFTITAVSNTYTLDLSLAKNFCIETTNTIAKSIAFLNVPKTANTIIQVSVLLTYTSVAAITHPTGTVWKDGTSPTFTAGMKYLILYTSYNNGITWLASAVGAW